MEYMEKRIDGETIFEGFIVTLRKDRVELVNGATANREVVDHPGGVTILPVDDAGWCYMVRQYRYPMGRAMLEAPAGKLERGEEHFPAAVRELSEETGFSAEQMVYLGPAVSSPGFCNEVLHIYLALGLHSGECHPDEDEFLNVEKYPLTELVEMAMRGEIDDAKTVIAVLKAEKYLKEHSANT